MHALQGRACDGEDVIDKIGVLMARAEEAAHNGMAKMGDPQLVLWVETWDHGLARYPGTNWTDGTPRYSLFLSSYAAAVHKRADAYHQLTAEQLDKVLDFYIARCAPDLPNVGPPPVAPVSDPFDYWRARRGEA